MKSPIIIIGGGLAGCEAAWQLAARNVAVELYEMKPARFSPAHKSPLLAELVCSNSLRSNNIENAVGLLKEEMRRLGSLVMEAADATAVPAGKALAVDRDKFSAYIEKKLSSRENLRIIRHELKNIPDDRLVIVATGPLTSDALAQIISGMTGSGYLYFYDAISPIIDGASINDAKVFRASRYQSEAGDYLNCPMDESEYREFWKALTEAKEVPLKTFEEIKCFEGCLPVETIAKRGVQTLLFGPMKPVGLKDPQSGRQPFAVVQLRQEDLNQSYFNMVGFQTKLTWPEQQRVFRMIPGLERAEFTRYGSMHRNTFINAPRILKKTLQLKSFDRVLFAGQIAGVEGYVESSSLGIIAGLNALFLSRGAIMTEPPETTAVGALVRHLTDTKPDRFQPMNVNFGLFPTLEKRIHKRFRGEKYAERALNDLSLWQQTLVNDGVPKIE
ncbi:MAG: methylenetetrahydrofolate--tRNA-(uracil(54)-C(5))-methyltransferase (FADH(2)-oxidizing) TrmFO [Deltaproteobacteria bacterium]|nr:methylenetetrahydrofolate--tRNA-(uracil(54)-C(5))-methyltransferase (FADH(2)-oxidizing) TrmFO [Deltaproteobacteria bacterium]